MKKLTLLFIIIQFALFSLKAENKTCNFFLIKEKGTEVILEKVQLTENEVKVFTDPSIISYIMVFGPGSKSGELIPQNQRIKGIIARYSGQQIHISILRKDNSQKEMPTLDLELAKKTDVRLNITGTNGYKKVYLIESFETIKEGEGPVLDMFAGQIPLKSGEYSFCTESMESVGETILEGSVPYEIYKGWITINCKLPNGLIGRFVVDFGATQTVIAKKDLPKDADIALFEMVEYSAQGIKRGNAKAAGATGIVDNIAGISYLSEFSFGNIKLEDFKMTILEDFPKLLNDYGIMGILGRDVLLNTNIIHISNFNNQEKKELIFSENSNYLNSKYSIPYTISGGHLFMNGKIGNQSVHYLFDSGAAKTYVSKSFLEQNNIPYSITSNETEKSMGLDGQSFDNVSIVVNNMTVGNIKSKEFNILMGDTYALEILGLNDSSVLLGLDFFGNYNNIIVDVKNQEIKVIN